MGNQRLEVIPGHSLAVELCLHVMVEFVIAQRQGRRREAAVAEVLAVDPHHVELIGQNLDLALEVDGGEAAVAQRTRKRVGRRCQLDAGVGQLPHQPGHEDGIARIIKLELVNADELVVAERFNRLAEGERPHEVGVFNKGAKGLRARRRVPEGRQEVRFSDAESAVQVDAGPGGVLLGKEAFEEAVAIARPDAGSEPFEGPDRCRLAWLGRIRAVAAEGDRTESWRRIKPLKEVIHGNRRSARGELFDLYQKWSVLLVCPQKEYRFQPDGSGHVIKAICPCVNGGKQ